MQPTSLPFRTDVQGLRGVAVLLVVLNHVGLLPAGFVGVDIFFVISGFVVVRSLGHALSRSDGPVTTTLVEFYKRRIARLLPAFAVTVGLMALTAVALGPIRALHASIGTGLWGLLLASNVYLYRIDEGYFDFASEDNAFLHLWSLSVEEQFYLLVPPILALIFWKQSPQRAVAIAGVVAVGLSAFSLWTSVDFTFGTGPLAQLVTASDVFAFYSPVTRAWEFGVGAILALYEPLWSRRGRPVLWRALGLMLLAVGIFAISETSPFPGWIAVLPVFGTAALIVARSTPFLEVRPIVWLGDLSYSWYLWHWPMIVFARAWFPGLWTFQAAVGLLSLLPAWLSYRWIEGGLRIRREDGLSERTRKFRTSLALGVLALVATVAAERWVTSPYHPAARWAEQARLHADVQSGCDATVTAPPGGECTWGEPDESSRPVFLIGDSQAGQLSEAFIEASERRGRLLRIRTASGCPTALPKTQESTADPPCVAANRSIVERLEVAPPSSVFLARSFPLQSAPPATPEPSQDLAFDALLDRLEAWGHRVVVVAPVPTFDNWWVGRCAAAHEWIGEGTACSFDRSVTDLPAAWHAERTYVQTLGARRPSIRVADFLEVLCPGGRCRSHRDGIPVWRDQTHLSAFGAQLLTEAVSDWLDELD